MKGKIILGIDEFSDYKYRFANDINPFDYEISINTKLDEDFISLINNTEDLEESIEDLIKFYQLTKGNIFEEEIEYLKECQKNKLSLLQNAEYIVFDFEDEEIAEYLKNNPILKTKKIILISELKLTTSEIEKYKDIYGEYIDNLYFNLPGNSNLISFNEYIATNKALEDMANEIKQFNFSPLEKIMYAYDMIRNKVYEEVSEDEDKTISRDLSTALLGDKIVCLGYSRIFEALLGKLGIKVNETRLDSALSNRQKGHARNEIYIKDDKYDIDGVYYFDTTWDSKKDKNDNKYLLSYLCFAKTRKFMDRIDHGKYINKRFPYYSSNLADEFEDIYNSKGFEKIPKEYIDSINYMSQVINGHYLFDALLTYPKSPRYGKIDIDATVDEIDRLVEYFNKPISADTLLMVLYNVRKQQYYHNPEKYPFSRDDLQKIVENSRWLFEGSAEKRLLKRLFGDKYEEHAKNGKNEIDDYFTKTNMEQKIDQIKLTKTLRKVYDKKINNN